MFSSALFVLAFAASSALANIFVTAPVASTTCQGGSPCTLSWMDDGTTPSIQTFGPASIGIFAGNAQQQTLLQLISSNVNVGTTSSVIFTASPTIGPNSDQYFIRFASIGLLQPGSAYPEEGFSARFTLANMSGQFNATVQQQINGQTTAPIGGSSTSGSTSTSTSKSSSSSTPSTTPTSKSSSSTGTSTAAKSTNTSGAGRLAISSAAGIVAVVAVLSFA